MRIISNGVKDYYDYLVSKYGIDNDVIYDRRNNFIIKCKDGLYGHNVFFPYKQNYDKPTELKRVYNNLHWEKKYVGKMYYFILEVGFKCYLFSIERYLDDNNELVFNPSLVKEVNNIGRLSDEPISITPCDVNVFSDSYKLFKQEQIVNPILSSIFIPSFIDAEEIYLNLYDYFIAIKDKPIIDTRNDVQKLESCGFDKKTSFRNPIYAANSKKKK